MPDPNLENQIKITYLKMIENSTNTRLFNSLYVLDKNKNKVFDALNDGELSCAMFVSGVLTMLGLIDRPHSTISTVLEKIADYGWKEIDPNNLAPGDIAVWEEVTFDDGTKNEHIGFILNNHEAVSTSYIEKKVIKHSLSFSERDGSNTRKIIRNFRNDFKNR